VAELKAAGCQRVFQEKIRGARSDRKQLARLLAELVDGDTVGVTRLDRLARWTRDLLNTMAAIVAANATFRSLHDAWADTTTPHGRLILTVLGGLADERHPIVARISEGRERARTRGVLFGRPPKLTPHQRREAIARRDAGAETLTDIARSYNVSHSTISRLSSPPGLIPRAREFRPRVGGPQLRNSPSPTRSPN
jgi:DNA invertase Pin-like site-specific DNA recombinase